MLHKWPLIGWARYAYIIGVVVAVIGIIPAAWFPMQLGKMAVFALGALVAGVLFVLGGGGGGLASKKGAWAVLLVGILPAAYLLSYVFSTDRSVGLLGYAVESDTVAFVSLAALAFVLSSILFRRRVAARTLLGGIVLTATLAVAFQYVSILFGSRVLSALFSDTTVNLVGKWNDLGILAGLALGVLLVVLERSALATPRRLAGYAVGAVLLLFLILVQFSVVWGLLLCVSLGLGVWSFFANGRTEARIHWKNLPWLPIVGVCVSTLLLIWGAAVQGGLVKVFPIASLEVRPSLGTTLDIVRASHGASVKSFFIGTGPNTFANDWFLYKPLAINQTQFWNLDFTVGYSTLVTTLDTVGVAGTLAWLVPLILVMLGMFRLLRTRASFSEEEKGIAGVLAIATIYLWGSMLFYVPSQTMLLLAFVLAGAAYAATQKDSSVETNPRRSVVWVWNAALVVCVIVLALITFYVGRRYMAEMYVNHGVIALQQQDISSALTLADKATGTERTGDTLRFGTLAGMQMLQAIAQATSSPSAEVQQQFAQEAQTTIALGQASIAANPSDYRAYIGFAQVYDLLNSLGVQGAYDTAKTLYAKAAEHNPTDPEIPLAVARLEAVHGDSKATMDALSKSLSLKADYTEAILFAVQLYVANKDINNAIIAAKAAVQSAPGVASIWFELGLLYYSSNDTKDAALALEQALKLQSNYANAKYFLGLSYAAQNRTEEAIQQFKDLEVTNSDNQEVKLILGNLESGKPPFEGAQPPVTSTPQKRTEAPIKQ